MRSYVYLLSLALLSATACSSGNKPASLRDLPPNPYLHIAPDDTPGTPIPGGGTVDDASKVVPTGDLAAVWDVAIPNIPDSTGINNALAVRSNAADIVTFSEDQGGGILLRCTYDSTTDELTKLAIPLNGPGQPLQNCHAYRLSYYPDGRLAIGAARRNPNSVREVRESAPGSGSFLFQTAVDNTFLPTAFDQPEFDYAIDSEGDPQVLFLRNDGVLGYAFNLFGSYGVSVIGPAVQGGLAMGLQGSDIVACYRRAGSTTDEIAVRRLQQVLPNDPGNLALGADSTLFTLAGTNTGLGADLVIGAGGSVYISAMGGTPELRSAASLDGQVPGTWTVGTVDSTHGGDIASGGAPSMGLLSDGTPVIAYHDRVAKQLRLAVSTTPVAAATGTSWTTYAIDKGATGATAGLFPALGVLQAAGGDRILVAYGLTKGTSRKLRTVILAAPPH